MILVFGDELPKGLLEFAEQEKLSAASIKAVGALSSLRLGWESKKTTAESISNPHIEEIHDAASRAGASAGKISGAGGGGFMIFFVTPDRRMDVARALSQFEGQISNCHFTKHGTQAWRTS